MYFKFGAMCFSLRKHLGRVEERYITENKGNAKMLFVKWTRCSLEVNSKAKSGLGYADTSVIRRKPERGQVDTGERPDTACRAAKLRVEKVKRCGYYIIGRVGQFGKIRLCCTILKHNNKTKKMICCIIENITLLCRKKP